MALSAALSFLPLNAEVKLPAFFSDNMVIQQQTEARFWGSARPSSTLSITPSWNGQRYKVKTDANGQWETSIPTPEAGGPYSICFDDGTDLVLDNVLVGEVWFCSGQSNMEEPMKGFPTQSVENATHDVFLSRDAGLRLLKVGNASKTEPQDDIKGTWTEADPTTVYAFSACAYYFGRYLRQALGVPVGLISSNWGGTAAEAWMSRDALKAFPQIEVPAAGKPIKGVKPTSLFNGMVHPFLGMAMRGCIWYQGESNYDHSEYYEDLFTALVAQWRQDWGIGEFPFYYCQIAPYDYSIITGEGQPVINSAYLREAQFKAEQRIPNCAMVVLLDGGDEVTIHPRRKQLAGERLAMKALAGTYGCKIDVESPRYASMEIKDSSIVVTFDHSPRYLDCTVCHSESVNFTIAGEDRVFYPAVAKIKWNTNTVEVSSPEVPHPVAVRYAFRNVVEGDLYGQNGMPVSSFRTDDWPIEPECIKTTK